VSGSRVALITANLQKIKLSKAVKEITNRLNQIEFPRGTYFRITGQSEEMRKSLSSLYWAMLLALFLTYIVLAAQFESWILPGAVLTAVPFGILGARSLTGCAASTTMSTFRSDSWC
jgi:HAE1 family hydrophobic/amphiphilic exporter-1